MSNQTTNHHGRTTLSGLSALGSNQTTAFMLLNAADHEFTTVGSSTGAVLPSAKLPSSLTVYNGGANTLAVYPPLGGTINGGPVNADMTVSTGSGAEFFAADTLTWYTAVAGASGGLGTVTSVAAGSGLTGGTITTTGTIALASPSATTLGGVQSAAAVAHEWINSISTSGVPALSQPAFSDISGSVAASQLPNPSATTLGGVQSAAAVAHEWINSISTSGVPALSQPAFSDLSGSATAAQLPTVGLELDQTQSAITVDTDGATITFNLALTNWHTVTLAGNRTLALSNGVTGQQFTLVLVQDGTGSRTVTWFSGIKWAGASAPTLTTTANKADIFTFKQTGTGAYYGMIAGQSF